MRGAAPVEGEKFYRLRRQGGEDTVGGQLSQKEQKQKRYRPALSKELSVMAEMSSVLSTR